MKDATRNMAMDGSNTRSSPFGKGQVLDHPEQSSPVLWQIPDPFDIKWKCFTDFRTIRICLWPKQREKNSKQLKDQCTKHHVSFDMSLWCTGGWLIKYLTSQKFYLKKNTTTTWIWKVLPAELWYSSANMIYHLISNGEEQSIFL